jgi:hypothetical protein
MLLLLRHLVVNFGGFAQYNFFWSVSQVVVEEKRMQLQGFPKSKLWYRSRLAVCTNLWEVSWSFSLLREKDLCGERKIFVGEVDSWKMVSRTAEPRNHRRGKAQATTRVPQVQALIQVQSFCLKLWRALRGRASLGYVTLESKVRTRRQPLNTSSLLFYGCNFFCRNSFLKQKGFRSSTKWNSRELG